MADRPSVLVVEDDASWRMIYQEILEEEGYRVGLAASQSEVVQIVDECAYDVAIVDLRLADNDSKNTAGIAVVELLRERGIPARVIVKSSYLTLRARAQLQQLGVFAIVDKDGGIDQLLQLIADALSES